ncbi:MAG: 4Fe-4S dicluster domain-containing protein [Synergistaceae bacterium]|jgi:Fe-S-cluster-containing hydrogenase component 2|nr:4Fe-4S dicluster domain-containing protein [Synergistaceae bacterium]
MVKRVLMVYPEKCTGCGSCELACSFTHEGEFRPSVSRIGVFRFDEGGSNVPMTCFQCEEPACLKVCKTGALWRDEEKDIVAFNESKCIGCRMCVMACPFGNISYNRTAKKASKCDQCDGLPQCVEFCPNKALDYLPADTENWNKKRAFTDKMRRALAEVK